MGTPPAYDDAEAKAAILIEALPFIRRFAGRIVVVKYGGNALASSSDTDPEKAESEALASFANDIVLMSSVGIRPVVVHGGGPQIGALMARLGKTPEFRDGLRVTDAETLDIARMVLVGKVNRDIVAALNVHGPVAVGMSGEDGAFITAAERDPRLGFVGDVVSIDPTIIYRLVDEGLIPVVATIGADRAGQSYNINADTVAGALAEALEAEKLVFLTDVTGIRAVRDDPDSVLSRTTPAELEQLVADGVVDGGMIPKVEACLRAVRGSVTSAHVLDGRIPHAVLLEFLTEAGPGTMIEEA
jgi:acetylglutamate kinase